MRIGSRQRRVLARALCPCATRAGVRWPGGAAVAGAPARAVVGPVQGASSGWGGASCFWGACVANSPVWGAPRRPRWPVTCAGARRGVCGLCFCRPCLVHRPGVAVDLRVLGPPCVVAASLAGAAFPAPRVVDAGWRCALACPLARVWAGWAGGAAGRLGPAASDGRGYASRWSLTPQGAWARCNLSLSLSLSLHT